MVIRQIVAILIVVWMIAILSKIKLDSYTTLGYKYYLLWYGKETKRRYIKIFKIKIK